MPVLTNHTYKAPFWLPGGNAQTIGPRVFCRLPRLSLFREHIETPDDDFFLVDWAFASGSPSKRSGKIAILTHGLEGDSTRSYMRAMALELTTSGWDVLLRNMRFCGSGINRQPPFYHSGETRDLGWCVELCEHRGYAHIGLVGFSAGGNQVLKYLGEQGAGLSSSVVSGVGISVPCDLTGCSVVLGQPSKKIYMEYFLKTLRGKIRQKHAMYPEIFPLEPLDTITTFKAFDDTYTAPLNGFKNAEDYWKKASSLPVLEAITVPALLLNARNDPFLSESCFPVAEATRNPNLFLLMPETGGHVGFPGPFGKIPGGWLEKTVAAFLDGSRAL